MKIFEITENDANQRLDKFLKKLFPNATRSLIYKFNRKSKIKILSLGADGFKKQDNEYKLQTGEKVKIFLSDKDFDELTAPPQASENMSAASGKKGLDKNDIVYEDGDILVLNKSAGINVHPGDHKTTEVSVIEQVHDYYAGQLNSLTFKPSLIHRIDRDTSGILMVAKKKNMLTKLVDDFKSHTKVQKTYYALVYGKLSRKKGTIKKNLLRIENAKNRNKVEVNEKGKTAITHYKVLKEHIVRTDQDVFVISELEVKIETGRMHQIRVHLAHVGNPILGDKAYGNKKLNSYFERHYGLKRQALHAWKIEFFHYTRDKKVELEARVKKDLKNVVEKIKE